MNIKKTIFHFLISILFFVPLSVFAQSEEIVQSERYSLGQVVEILDEGMRDLAGLSEFYQTVRVKIIDGEEKGKEIEIEHGEIISVTEERRIEEGEKLILQKNQFGEVITYLIIDKYRSSALIYIFLIFLVLVFAVGRFQGLRSILALCISIFIIIHWIIPAILAGGSPLFISLIGSFVITIITIYLAHGFKKRTTIAVVSTLITLTISLFLATLFVSFAKLYGFGSEDAFFLQLIPDQKINLRGLLLGGMIIGALGVLDDVTTAQTAAIDELKKANDRFTFWELYHRGMSVGKEHIASMINTLALAYVGASFPLLILFTLPNSQPLWVLMNSEFMAEEIVRTLVGSMSLVLAVPIATLLAAYVFGKSESRRVF